MLDWVRIKKFCELSGYSDDAVRAKISQGVWREGIVWKTPPNSRDVLISQSGYDAWVEGQESALLVQRQSKWTSAGRVSGAGNVYGLSPRQRTSNGPQD
jgi:predicted HNH restriction endonuclease